MDHVLSNPGRKVAQPRTASPGYNADDNTDGEKKKKKKKNNASYCLTVLQLVEKFQTVETVERLKMTILQRALPDM